MLRDHFLPTDSVTLQQNVLLVETDNAKVLFDTGMGFSRAYGWRAGQLLRNMHGAGIDPREIGYVAITHGHIDHVGGLVNESKVRNFPNATVFMAKADFDFWTKEADFGPAKPPEFVAHARWNLIPYRDAGKLAFVEDGDEFLPDVTAITSKGHTLGHTVYSISSDDGKDSLLFLGDLVHHPVLLLQRPFTEFAYDTNALQAVASRVKLLGDISKGRMRVHGYHFPWPGLGHIAADPQENHIFHYYPEPMELSSYATSHLVEESSFQYAKIAGQD